MTQDTDAVERRTFDRATSVIMGTIHLHEGRSYPCGLRDISAMGARVSLPRGALVPDEFMVAVGPPTNVRRARLVWRRIDEIGIEFLG